MSIFRKSVTVSFFVVEPSPGPEKTFAGDFPADEVLDTVAGLDLATGDFHVKDGLFANEMFCTVHEGPMRLLGAYSKDLYAAVATERKGEIRELEMSDGEGIVDATYVAFFPDSVAALLRTSVKSPGSARTASWLSLFGGYSCFFSAMPQGDVMNRLDRHPSEISSVFFRAKKSRLDVILGGSSSVAAALEAAAKVSRSSKLGLTLGVERQSEKAEWWHEMRAVLADMIEVLPEFESARIEVTHGKNINLLDAYVTARVEAEIDGAKRIRPVDAARAIADAYEQEQAAIRMAVSSRHLGS